MRALLHPLQVLYLVDQLTDEEADELLIYAMQDGMREYPYRATEWLLDRFSDRCIYAAQAQGNRNTVH